MHRRKILVLGNYRQTLIVLRSLARAGYSVIIGRENGNPSIVERSRFISGFWPHPNFIKEEKAFLLKLREFLRDNPDVTLVFPVHEGQISCLLKHYDDIKGLARFVMPEQEILRIFLSKKRSHDLALKADVPFAQTEYATDIAGVKDAAERIGYPVVVKPDSPLRPFRGKAAIVHTTEAMDTALPEWPRDNDFLVVQSYRPGLRHNFHFFAHRGEIVVYFEHKVLRTDYPDNTGLGVENITVRPTRELLRYTAALVAAVGYNGIGCAQFLLDPEAQSINFLELNPRLDANCAIPYRYGLDLPRLAVESIEYAAIRPTAKVSDYPEGKLYYWMTRDLEVLIEDIREKSIDPQVIRKRMVRIMKCLSSADGHIIWSPEDPMPTIAYISGKATNFFSKVLRGRRK